MTNKELTEKISELALEKKGYEVKIMELGKITNTCEYFVLITGDTEVHARAIADNIEDKLAAEDITLWHKEGYGNANWILMDYIDVVVHVFKPEKRDYYNLDNLWADAKVKLVRDGVK
ncbi:MAG: ribosome silencing factor [Calditrichia bacterium]|nr:ribosome silencing factor [Calditrichia bacterium]